MNSRRFTASASRASDRKDSTPQVRQETAALRDFDPAYDRFGSKMRKSHSGHFSTAVPLKSDIARRGWHGREVQEPDSCTATNKMKGSSDFKRPIHVHICAARRLNASCACAARTPENIMEGVYAPCRQPKIWRVWFSHAHIGQRRSNLC
jgi:hypothetical protein